MKSYIYLYTHVYCNGKYIVVNECHYLSLRFALSWVALTPFCLRSLRLSCRSAAGLLLYGIQVCQINTMNF